MSVRNIQYLNRIVDFLVDDTEISEADKRQYFISGDGDKKIMITPFGVLRWDYFLSNQGTPYILFVEYIEDNYGVARSEVRYVWDSYVSKIKEKIQQLLNLNPDDVNENSKKLHDERKFL